MQMTTKDGLIQFPSAMIMNQTDLEVFVLIKDPYENNEIWDNDFSYVEGISFGFDDFKEIPVKICFIRTHHFCPALESNQILVTFTLLNKKGK